MHYALHTTHCTTHYTLLPPHTLVTTPHPITPDLAKGRIPLALLLGEARRNPNFGPQLK